MPILVRLSGCTSMFNFLYVLATLGLSFRPIPNMFLQSQSLHARIPATVWAKWTSASVGSATSVGLGEAVPASAVDGPVGAVMAGSKMAARAGETATADLDGIGCTFLIVVPETTPINMQTCSHLSLLTKCLVKMSAAITSDTQSLNTISSPRNRSWSQATDTQWVRLQRRRVGARPVLMMRAVA